MKLKILIAEDSSLIRMDLSEILKLNGYEVIGEACDGLECLNLVKILKPDIILLDIKMPLLNGINVARILKEENYQGCIIMLTAYSNKDYIKESSENGVAGYLIKPLNEDVLLGQISFCYKNFKEKKDLEESVVKIEKKLKERKELDKAKGILMAKYSLTEEEAYKKIRTISMEKRMEVSVLVEIINRSGELL
jgi:response regulator NasT